MEMANAIAYYTAVSATSVNSFIVQALALKSDKKLTVMILIDLVTRSQLASSTLQLGGAT